MLLFAFYADFADFTAGGFTFVTSAFAFMEFEFSPFASVDYCYACGFFIYAERGSFIED